MVGPTAIGKTALAIQIAKQYNCDIISCDSRQFYKEMNIGTAKPDEALQKEIPHHLINLITPDKQYNVSDFVNAADIACEEINSRLAAKKPLRKCLFR